MAEKGRQNLDAPGDSASVAALCLGCGAMPEDLADAAANQRSAECPACGGRRIIRHKELFALQIAHIDCDAFYAAVEKRDAPELADRPVIVGGGVRGVVTTACYVARTYGVRSAMPMFKALKLCPDAVVIKPDFAKYAAAARAVRAMMEALTPLVEPVSIDEAFLDLSGTERVHRAPPAARLAKLQREIKRDIGITVSVGLSVNKFLAKTASDFDKPNGFSVIGAAEARSVLARLPVSAIWGVGAVTARRLENDGFRMIADLQRADAAGLARRYGEIGLRLASLAEGRDARRVNIVRETKSVSSETTFNSDLSDLDELEAVLWRLAEKTAKRMKAQNFAGRVVTLKLKTADFKTVTRRVTLERPSNLARTAFDAARPLLKDSHGGRSYRLIGIGYCALETAGVAAQSDMFGGAEAKLRKEEEAIDAIRRKFGENAIALGRGYAKSDRKNRAQKIEESDDGND